MKQWKKLFKNTKVKITNPGKRCLGSAIGTVTFEKKYANEMLSQWISEIKFSNQIAKIEQQASWCCFTTGFKHTITYLMHTTPSINEELRRLEDATNNKLIPSFTCNKLCGNDEQLLLSLPIKLGGMEIPFFSWNHGNRISELVAINRRTHIINNTTRSKTQNSNRNYKQNQEENKTGKTRV